MLAGYFTAPSVPTLQHIASNGRMMDELERAWKKSAVA
jgi:hypothetical protein